MTHTLTRRPNYPIYEKAYDLFQELIKKAPERGCIDFNKYENIRFEDNIHSTNESSIIIAKVFAEKILYELHEKRK